METWLHRDVPDDNATIKGFHTVRVDRDCARSRNTFISPPPITSTLIISEEQQESDEMGNSLGLSLDSSKASPKANVCSDTKEDYDCPICKEVLKMPIRTKNCQHVFCWSCFQTAVRIQGRHCPLCRSPVYERVRRATDIRNRMKQTKGKCRACGKKEFICNMRIHYKFCRKYIEEFGPISDPTLPLPNQLPNLPESSIFTHNTPIPTPSSSAGRVYPCPYCSLMDRSNIALTEHCVCPYHQDCTPINESDSEDMQLSWARQISVQEF
ncbi:E3 ubiquitin-protein ligase RNF138-like [Neoarius graeffei]|uniref:E3 ubiquitin-protein ligase RNF138-like n=1 Tax=Neoarius graeffei TaxID=443677 RepID=UPI00298C8173|nr:E3 ubiquitin-protein ligase RNF138-like [Neoarius graeffei]